MATKTPVKPVQKEVISGLTPQEVLDARKAHGSNQITEQASESFWDKLKGNFEDPIIRILLFALLINVVFAIMGQTEWYETIGIAVAVLLATFVSTFSEYRNESAFQRLQDEASQISCKVYRNGSVTEIPIDEIVVGDAVILQAGDKIPADGLLIEGTIKVDQAVLNGESKEATKQPRPKGYEEESSGIDFLNPYKVFRGTVVCNGNGVFLVTTVGDKTVYGEIARELQQDEDRDSPLKVKLTHLAEGISKFGYIGGILIAVAFLFQRIVIHNHFVLADIISYASNWMVLVNDIVQAIILAVIIIVMAVPEGLPLMIAIVSALNMGKMLKDNVLVRKIAGIETAGSLNILFSDKTGTITRGKLEAVVFVDGEGKNYNSYPELGARLGELLSLSACHNSSAMLTKEGKDWQTIGGNATERAILGFVACDYQNRNIVAVESLPFNSENKYSATQVEGDYTGTLIKGAPEKIIGHCTSYFDAQGIKRPLESGRKIENEIDTLATRAIRVLALAISDSPLVEGELPKGEWTLVGVVGIRDEIRPESIDAIEEAMGAGIQVVMITGDRKDTAIAIAKEVGLLKDPKDLVLTSDELQEMSDAVLASRLPDIRVVARALPRDKSRLVKIAQERNLVVGMTGDGVNDAPALKRADVGFAMGGGTEVAKEASDIVILDDNFSSIEKAVLYGRTIFNSIRKFIIFQLTINVSAVLISFFAPLLGMEHPLSITQILWINLVMDTLAALAFGGEPALKRFMAEKPKRRDEPIVSTSMWSSILVGSGWVFLVSMVMLLTPFAARFFRPDEGNIYLLTGYFAFFILAAVFNAFNTRTDEVNIFKDLSKNKGFIQIILLIVGVQVFMTYFGNVILRTYGLNAKEWLFVVGAAITIIPVDLLRKTVVASFAKKDAAKQKA